MGESGEIPLDYYHINVGGTITLLQMMEKYNVKNFVFSSSATVYGTPKVIPIPETSAIQPESAYGKSKAMVETVMQDQARASATKHGKDAFKAISVRYFK